MFFGLCFVFGGLFGFCFCWLGCACMLFGVCFIAVWREVAMFVGGVGVSVGWKGLGAGVSVAVFVLFWFFLLSEFLDAV